MATTTMDRVAVNTPDAFNERIEQCTRERVARCAAAGPEAIQRRLEELDHEWDVERTLETVAPSFTLTGIMLGLTVNRKWFALPLVVNAFFL
ncbi:MAG: hypothetical protein K8T25_01560, partial [Planctomycetia bacterium]|nr:hypothetical protein [Planctomycetia bacterium]